MDGPVLLLLLYVETIIPFLVCGCLHMNYITIYHTIFSITARPSPGSCDSGRPAPSRIWRELQEAALNQRRRAGILSNAA